MHFWGWAFPRYRFPVISDIDPRKADNYVGCLWWNLEWISKHIVSLTARMSHILWFPSCWWILIEKYSIWGDVRWYECSVFGTWSPLTGLHTHIVIRYWSHWVPGTHKLPLLNQAQCSALCGLHRALCCEKVKQCLPWRSKTACICCEGFLNNC